MAERTQIQGKTAESKEEAWIATALEKYGHVYIYQYEIFDIRGVRGAYKVDFLVLTAVPFSLPLEHFGEYWHKGQMAAEDAFRLAQIEDYFRNQGNRVAIIWGSDTLTYEDTENAVLRVVGPA